MDKQNHTNYKTQSYTIKDFYNSYIDYIETGTQYDIPYTTFKAIIIEYFQHIKDNLIENSKEIKLPCRLGTLAIVKRKPKNYDSKSLRVDYHATKLYSKTIYHLNEHSNGWKYNFHWSKKDMCVKNKSAYQFVACRALKRQLAQYIKNNIHDYIPI